MLRAGSAALDLTPDPSVSLLGYDFRQECLPPGNDGVLDRLQTRALALSDGRQLAVLISNDLCILSQAWCRRVRQAVAQALAITPAAVIVANSHTHSGPWLREPELESAVAGVLPHADTGASTSDPLRIYAASLEARMVEAARRAAGLLVPVRLVVRQAPLGLGYCRRVSTPQGVRHCWNPQEYPELDPGPAADPTLVVVDLVQTNGPRRFTIVNHGAHPVVLGKTSRQVSADWPGAMLACLRAWLPGCEPTFLLGACGDVHPWIATQGQAAGVATVGRAVAALATLLVEAGGQGLEEAPLTCGDLTRRLGPWDLDLTAWRIGPVQLLAAPVELFAELGTRLRRAIPQPLLLTTNANGWAGYWPPAAAFSSDDYETRAARSLGLQAGDGERLIEALLELVAGLGS